MKTLAKVTVNQLKAEAKSLGIKGYSRMTKANLIQALDDAYRAEAASEKYPINPLDDPEVQALDVSDEVLMSPETEGDLEEMSVKELNSKAKSLGIKDCSQMTKTALIRTIEQTESEESITTDEPVVEEKRNTKDKYFDPKWDKLVKAVAAEYVKQSLGVKWALFYKNTKATTTKAEYLVKTKKLWGATSKVIKSLYGEKNCNENTIQQTLNTMVVRGYINFQRIQGRNGINVIFNATADQMNAMWKLSK